MPGAAGMNGRSAPAPAWRFRLPPAMVLLPWILAVGGWANGIYGWIHTGGVNDANYSNDKRHQAEFEVSVDQRLNKHTSQIEAIYVDRDERSKATTKEISDLRSDLRARVDELNKRFAERTEFRTNEMADVKQRIYGLEIKYCGMAGVRLAGCK